MKTDTQITHSASTGKRFERTLQKFDFSAGASSNTNNAQFNSNNSGPTTTSKGLSRNLETAGGSWRTGGPTTGGANLLSLEDDIGGEFNQFEGKRSTYDESLYTTRIDEKKVTKDLKEYATKMEKVILTE